MVGEISFDVSGKSELSKKGYSFTFHYVMII